MITCPKYSCRINENDMSCNECGYKIPRYYGIAKCKYYREQHNLLGGVYRKCIYGYGSSVSNEKYEKYCKDGNTCDYLSGNCFITTACVSYFGKTDDCEELECLREFRDEYLLKSENGL